MAIRGSIPAPTFSSSEGELMKLLNLRTKKEITGKNFTEIIFDQNILEESSVDDSLTEKEIAEVGSYLQNLSHSSFSALKVSLTRILFFGWIPSLRYFPPKNFIYLKGGGDIYYFPNILDCSLLFLSLNSSLSICKLFVHLSFLLFLHSVLSFILTFFSFMYLFVHFRQSFLSSLTFLPFYLFLFLSVFLSFFMVCQSVLIISYYYLFWKI